jgi:hypothetical protein
MKKIQFNISNIHVLIQQLIGQLQRRHNYKAIAIKTKTTEKPGQT